jgi:uncharacterized protein
MRMGKHFLCWSILGMLSAPCLSQSLVPERNNPWVLVQPSVQPQAYAIDLGEVRLLNSPFRHAMDLDSGYLLSLSADRLLHRFYENAHLQPKAPVYGGWESDGLSGHTLGHYLSACSMMYAATGSHEFASRVHYIVQELRICQQARGTGYVGAIPKEDTMWAQVARGDIHSSGFDLNGGWSPWYTVHKLLAGLMDAYLYTHDTLALQVASRLGDWTATELSALSPDQIQKMLGCEFGGMNEAMANLYALTGKSLYLRVAGDFYHKAVLDPLSQNKDILAGKHSNTQIPKIIGSARLYELGGGSVDAAIALNFWHIVVDHHSYVTGGNSDHEYLGQADHLNDYLSESTTESCNTYNMLKLTRHLFSWNPDGRLGDYYERALYNHILASQNPTNAMMCYFLPLRMGTEKQFSDSTETFTCCVGSGMENHSKYGEGIYYEGVDSSLYVNLYIPSVLHFRTQGITLVQQTRYPYGDTVNFTIGDEGTRGGARFAMRFRQPAWVGSGMQVSVNGRAIEVSLDHGFAVVTRTWHKGDRVKVVLPMHLYTEALPDNPNRVALLYGPIVLAGDLGKKDPSQDIHGVPVLLTSDHKVNDWVHCVSRDKLVFQTKGVGKPFDITLRPFFSLYDHYYSVYWDYFSQGDWAKREVAYEAALKYKKAIEDRTVDIMRLGEMQPERDHKLTSLISYVGDEESHPSRECRNGGFFAFDMKVSPGSGDSLLVSAWGGDAGREADIFVDSTQIGTLALNKPKPNDLVDRVFAIPDSLVSGRAQVRITFRSPIGKSTGSIFFVRTLAAVPDALAMPARDYPIQPVPFTQVRVVDHFWAPKIDVNREVTIPYVLRMCREHGRIANFVAAAQHSGAKLSVYPFDDTDLYKAIEGASYGLQVHPDPALSKELDSLIAIIGAAQEPDGYLYTFRSANEAHPHEWIGQHRWQNEEILSHELYNAGHLYEAAVAHYQATGQRNLLDIALKNADLLCRTFGYGKEEKYPGHQIVEIGLAKLYRVTGEQKYLDLAKFFLDIRGPKGESYNQADKRVVDQDSAEGHAVRAGYMYTGMADVAALTGNQPYEKAIDAIWTDVASSKLYITGGIGSTNDGEAFGGPYELPNMSAYAETCASIANVYWNSRMFLLHGDAKYIDVLERTLYNGLLSGVSLSGTRFFYPNPLASMGQNQRSAWFDCACCISNMARFLPSMPGYIYAHTGKEIYVNLFVGSDMHVRLDSGEFKLSQQTEYPWEGLVSIHVDPARPMEASLRIRIPGWAKGRPSANGLYISGAQVEAVSIAVNGSPVAYHEEKGYAILDRTWTAGDLVSVNFPMVTQKVMANPLVKDDTGRFAFQRGPIVYCLEGPDNPDSLVRNIVVDTQAMAQVNYQASLLGGIDEITVQGTALRRVSGPNVPMGVSATTEEVKAIPYFTWANRGASEMTVWIPYENGASYPLPSPTIASRSSISSSIGKPRMLKALNDQYDPKDSKDNAMPYFHWWPRKDTTEWVQYDFDSVRTVSSSKVYWFDDGPWGGCRIPAAWKLYFLKDGQWIAVHANTPYEIAKDRYCQVQFDPVQTQAMRLEVRLPVDNSSGIHEWSLQ